MNIAAALALFIAAADAAPPADGSSCMTPTGVDGLPHGLASPKELAHRALAPGASFTAGPLKIALKRAVMPAYVGAETGEAVVDADVVVVGTDQSDSVHLPATVRIGTYRVRFDDVGKTSASSYDVVAEDLGCAGEVKGKALKKGEAMTVWLSTEGVKSLHLFEGDDEYSTGDYIEVNISSGLNVNSNRKVMVDDKLRPLTPGYISLRAFARNDKGNDAHDLSSPALLDKTPKPITVPGHTIEVLKVVHGPGTRLRFQEPYTLTDPVVNVLVRIKRIG